MEMTEAPTGFMVIKRAVFERLMASYPDLAYVPDSIGEADLGLHYRFFDVMVDPQTRRYLSEDYGFCRLVGAGRVDLHRRQFQPDTPGRQAVPRRLRQLAADLPAPCGGRPGPARRWCSRARSTCSPTRLALS